jgi:bacteriocin-like protein
MELSKNELNEIVGGAKFDYGLATLIGTGLMFLIGLIDGYLRPLSCNK